MSRTVVWSDRAVRDLRRLDRTIARRVLTAIARYAEIEHGDVRRLENVEPPTWRLRVGDYRVRFRIEAAPPPRTAERADGTAESDSEPRPTEQLLIQRVLHRREAYRD